MRHTKIPVLDLTPSLEALRDDYLAAFAKVLDSGQFIMGPEVKAFEAETAAYLNAAHAIGVNSGTDAMTIALRAVGVKPGDEVITTPFTFFATAESISQDSATPVFADIDPQTFNLDPAALAAAITPNTTAVVPVHLYGQTANMEAIAAIAREHGLKIVEDVAQAFGASHGGRPAGTLGDAGAFSFFPSKNLGGFGDAGMIATDDDTVAELARMLRTHGAQKKYYNETIGYNSRLDAVQAALLRVKLPYIDEMNAGRRRAAAVYNELFADVDGVTIPFAHDAGTHVYHQYTVRIAGGRRDAVKQALADAGIGSMVYYPVPCHRLPLYDMPPGSFPQAEQAAAEVLSLPIWPEIGRAVQARVTAVLRDFLRKP